MRHTIKTGVIVLVVAALAMTGMALAQTDEGAESTPEPTVVDRIAEHLAPLVDDGTLSAEQAEAVAEFLAENAPRRDRDGFRDRIKDRAHRGLETVADVLGVEIEVVREGLADGLTIAEIAEANGSTADAVIAAMLAQVEAHVAEAVESGKIDEERAAEILERAEAHITTFVNEGPPERPFGDRPGHRPGHGRRGPGGGFGGGFGQSSGTSA